MAETILTLILALALSLLSSVDTELYIPDFWDVPTEVEEIQ